MKKLLVFTGMLLMVWGAQAQHRKYIANFSLVRQYYNPALTGYEGSVLKGYYRRQWSGFDQAPQTAFVSAEFNLADLKAWQQEDLLKTQSEDAYNRDQHAKHGLGVSLLKDELGPMGEQQFNLSYGMRIRLSEELSLRWGAAFQYSGYRLNGRELRVEDEVDPKFKDYLQQKNRLDKLGLGMGLMLTSQNFYLGYALQDVGKEKLLLGGDVYLKGAFPPQHLVQAGYRMPVSDQAGLILNGMCQYNDKLKETWEGQLKGVFRNMFWLSAGYRHELAYTLGGGARIKQLTVGYVHESAGGQAGYVNHGSHEVMLTFRLLPEKYPRYSRQINMW